MTIRLASRSFGSSFLTQEVTLSVATTQPYHGSHLIPRREPATVSDARARDVVGFVGGNDLGGTAFDAALLPGRLERTITPADIELQGGLPVDQVAQLMEAFGLPRPAASDPAFTPQEAQVLVELRNVDDVWPAEVRMQVARAYGAMLAGIARAELQAFQTYTEPQLLAQELDPMARLRATRAAFARLLPLADPLLLGVHRRCIEHELSQRAVSAAEGSAGVGALPGAVDVTFLFCDLKDFTAYAEANGDAAALAAVDRFFDAVARERGDSGEFVKSLGDGAMLAYSNPVDAVSAGARVIAAMRSGGPPAVHAAVHRGTAVARSGDYFGGPVNLAARLLAFADGDELLATAGVVDACDTAFDWMLAGERKLRGFTAPLTVYKLGRCRRGPLTLGPVR
jgi:class 3 adenylate cyclase